MAAVRNLYKIMSWKRKNSSSQDFTLTGNLAALLTLPFACAQERFVGTVRDPSVHFRERLRVDEWVPEGDLREF